MGIIIRKTGLFSSVQGLGMTGRARFGVNAGGVMDRTAARLVNILVGESDDACVIESHFPAVEIEFDGPTAFAIGGADLAPQLNGEPISNWRAIDGAKGDILRFSAKRLGSRAYIAVAGLRAEPRRILGREDRLETGRSVVKHRRTRFVSTSLIPRYSRFPTVRVFAGPEFDLIGEDDRKTIFESNFVISTASDRMGYRLDGPPIAIREQCEMVSAAVTFGTIQLPPGGQLIVLMADHPTSGGYPRLLQVACVDLPLLAQLDGGDKVAFHLISVDDAELLRQTFETDLRLFRVGCSF